MARQQRVKSESGYYHIMIRGNERRNLFHCEDDKLRFMEILKEKKQGDRFFLHAFCLMDNHVHLMLSEGTEDVAKVMKRITVSYVSYFNRKYKRVGHLFQDRYKSESVEEDAYVLALIRYIHQNPVKAGMVESAGDYPWSSYNGYLEAENCFAEVIETKTVLGLLSDHESVAKERFTEYMNEEAEEEFLDVVEKDDVMEEEMAKELYEDMLLSENTTEGSRRAPVTDALIKEFKVKTNFSIRKIAEITGLNKNRVNKMLKTYT